MQIFGKKGLVMNNGTTDESTKKLLLDVFVSMAKDGNVRNDDIHFVHRIVSTLRARSDIANTILLSLHGFISTFPPDDLDHCLTNVLLPVIFISVEDLKLLQYGDWHWRTRLSTWWERGWVVYWKLWRHAVWPSVKKTAGPIPSAPPATPEDMLASASGPTPTSTSTTNTSTSNTLTSTATTSTATITSTLSNTSANNAATLVENEAKGADGSFVPMKRSELTAALNKEAVVSLSTVHTNIRDNFSAKLLLKDLRDGLFRIARSGRKSAVLIFNVTAVPAALGEAAWDKVTASLSSSDELIKTQVHFKKGEYEERALFKAFTQVLNENIPCSVDVDSMLFLRDTHIPCYKW